MLYYLYELNHAAVAPWRAAANFGRFFWKNPGNPLSGTYIARSMAASLDMFERVTRRYGKPEFGINETRINGERLPGRRGGRLAAALLPAVAFSSRSRRTAGAGADAEGADRRADVGPLCDPAARHGRGDAAHADVYITDWADAREVPAVQGRLRSRRLYRLPHRRCSTLSGPARHVMAVCQPSVPVLAAVSLMEAGQ